MKKHLAMIGTLLLSTYSFAYTPTSFSKNSPTLSALGSAWKAQRSSSQPNQNDLTVVYGGADVSKSPNLPEIVAA